MNYESIGFSGVTSAQKDIIAYWASCCTQGRLPQRGDLDPGILRAQLSGISIIQVQAEGDVRFRLAGSGLRSIFGREVRGRTLSELPGDIADMWSLGLRSVLERRAPVGGLIERAHDQHAWLRLPLESETGGALVLCHDSLLPKQRKRVTEKAHSIGLSSYRPAYAA